MPKTIIPSTCPSPNDRDLMQRLAGIDRIPLIVDSIPSGLFSNFKVVKVTKDAIQVIVPGGPGQGERPTQRTLSFKKRLVLIFDIPKKVKTIVDVHVSIKGINPDNDLFGELSDFEGELVQIGKNFIEVVKRQGTLKGLLLIPINKFLSIECGEPE